MSPTTGWGASLFAEVAAPAGGAWRPVLRAGLFLNRSEVTLASGPEAEFQWAALLAEGCPVRIGAFDDRLVIDPCLAFHVGVLRGRGRNLDVPATTTNPWADLGPVLRIGVAITERFSLEAQGMLVFPLHRLTFDVEGGGPAQPPTTVFVVPRFGGLAGIGVVYAFR